jgi:MFS transporter, UMF1 family
MARSLYPLSGLPKQGQIWSWISFDVANQSFTLIINTLLFSVFFAEVVVQDKAVEARWWFATYGTSMILTALLSPIVGAIADERAWKKEMLLLSGLVCATLTCLFAFIPAGGPGKPWALYLTMMLYIPANLAFSLGENFLASFLPSLAKQDQVGRVSGFSWGTAYFAALVLLGITAGAMLLFKLETPEKWRPFFVLAGVWFFLFMIPTALRLHEPPVETRTHAGRNLVTIGFVRLAESMRQTATYRDLAMLLVASLFYGTAMSVIVFFASMLAKEHGFQDARLVMFVAVITVSGVLGTLLPTLVQDRLGHKKTVLLILSIWILTSCGFAYYAWAYPPGAANHPPVWPLWLIGNMLGFGLGSLGSANRAFVGFLAPPAKAGEVFGLWGLAFKLAAVMTLPFAWVKDTMGTPQALLVLAGFVVVGFVLTMLIDERRGHAAAGA